MTAKARRWSGRRRGVAGSEDGQILILILGYVIVAVTLVIVAVDITALHLARTQLLDAADAAALDAADAVDPGSVYRAGVPGAVPLTTATVRAAATTYLSTYAPPTRVTDVQLTAATGSPDGQTAVVELVARVKLPLLGPVVQAWSGGITVTVRSQARADIDR
jgi:uncharacterized membrane protein